MSDVFYNSPSDGDLDFTAEHMRPDDRVEFETVSGTDARDGLERAVKVSREKGYAVCDEGVLCVYGIRPLTFEYGKGEPWMACTKLVEKHPIEFYRKTKTGLFELAHQYSLLENYVWAENTLAKRWLKWLGFEFGSEPVKARGLSFLKFRMEI